MTRPVLLEVLSPLLTTMYHCPHCEYIANQADLRLSERVHTEEINEYPEDWKAEYLHLSEWLRAMVAHYGPSVRIRVLDPQSLQGFWKSIKYRVWRYPAFVVEGRERFVGWEAEPRLHEALRRHLEARGLPLPQGEFRLLRMPTLQLKP